jgi:hypothetical protein
VVVAAGETLDLRIVLGVEAVTLERVTVRGERVCRIREDSGRLVAQVWEEARKAMLASRLAAAERSLDTRWFIYDRTMDSLGRYVKTQTVALKSGNTARPFFAETPESLDRFGYVTRVGADVVYRAPDEAVLLSDLFAATHCFQLEPPPKGGADWVGVAFRPARERGEISDVAGTFWLDRVSGELRVLEMRYTRLPRAYEDAGVGARVEFRRLPSGQWFVNRWHIRMAQMAVTLFSAGPALHVPGKLGASSNFGSTDGSLIVPRAIIVAGGEVAEVKRAGEVLYDGGGATYVALVRRADTVTVLAGTTVDFKGTGYLATADSAGEARLAHVLPGRYHTTLATPLMREARLAPIERVVEVTERARLDTMTLPSVEDLVARECGGPRAARAGDLRPAMLYGTLTDDAGRPIADATVTLSYPQRARIIAGGQVQMTSTAVDMTTDADGRWRACGVPRERPLELRALWDGRASPLVRLRLDAAEAAARIPLTVRRPVPPPADSP